MLAEALRKSHLTFVLMARSISDFTNGSLKRNIGRDIIQCGKLGLSMQEGIYEKVEGGTYSV